MADGRDVTPAPRAGRAVSVRWALAAVVVVPLVALSVLAATTVSRATADAGISRDIAQRSREVRELAELETALAVETYFGAAVAALDSFGLPPGSIEDFIGLDVESEWAAARAEVDDVIPDDDAGRFTDLLGAARASDVDAGSIVSLYSRASEELADRFETTRVDLRELAASGPAPRRMARSIRTISDAAELRDQVGTMASNLFGARFPSEAPTGEAPRRLIGADARYEAARERIQTAVAGGSDAAEMLATIEQDPALLAFLASIDDTIRAITAGEPPVGDTIDFDAEAAMFMGSLVAIERYGDLVQQTAGELAELSAGLADDAVSSQRWVIAVALATVAVSLLIAVLIGRWIGVSVRDLGAAASGMDDGQLDERAAVAGPLEVRVAAQALNDAVGHLQSAERQALALASDDLDSPVLAERVPGQLGDSLQQALQRLATSMEEREEFRRRLHHEASHDALTTLPNRSAIIAGLGRALARSRRGGGSVAVLYVDLNGFKRINDQNGHATGDRVLRTIAERIRATTRESDLIGRLGGDEFVVVADPVADLDEAVALAHRLRAAISEPVPTATTTSVTPGASIGIAMGDTEELTPDEILRDADLAVYRAKETGSGVEVCDVDLRNELAHRYSVEERLAEAIDADQLELYYQPIVDAEDGAAVGVEALVRWPRPDGTIVPPDAFIPIAERSDLIIDLDRWVVESAATQLAEWTEHPTLGATSMSVNISARHVSTRGFAGEVMDILHRHGVEPRRLVVEVTESALLADLEHVVTELEHLRRRGVRIAIDDFGTGYTSLALLLQLPIDVLKLDRSLIERLDDPKDRSIVQLIIDTGHLLGVTITAEGIETADQAEDLATLGSDHLQGYHFARPVPVSQLADRMSGAPTG